jgi:hypothetical protein
MANLLLIEISQTVELLCYLRKAMFEISLFTLALVALTNVHSAFFILQLLIRPLLLLGRFFNDIHNIMLIDRYRSIVVLLVTRLLFKHLPGSLHFRAAIEVQVDIDSFVDAQGACRL